MLYRSISLLVLLLSTTTAFAQFGLNGGFRINEPSEWKFQDQLASSEPRLIENGLSLGIDYWFRLKNQRVEFLPELNYGRYTSSPTTQLDVELDAYSFFFNTHFYIFDFSGDCDCPTFSKGGDVLQKGFFVRLSPGITWFQQAYELEGKRFETDHWAASIAGGAGFDIGLSDLVTITPLVELRYYPSVDWAGLGGIDDTLAGLELAGEEGHLLQLMAGLRLGVRLDYR